MLVITRWRPVTTGHGQNFGSHAVELLTSIKTATSKSQKISGRERAAYYYNESGHEIVSVSKIANFAALDAIEADPVNTEMGLRLLKMGYGIASVDYLREIDGLSQLADAFQKL
jgi:hypothetical protein